jgi:hypothetical protein
MRFKDDSYNIDVGTFVMNNHHGLLRMGVVKEKRITDRGWAMYKVDFLEDDIYVANKTHHSKMSGKDQFQTEHRRDQLVKVNPKWLQNVLDSYKEIQND